MHVPLDSGPGYTFCFSFFPFLHFCVYSAFISEKLQPASGDCLSPLGVLVIGLSPTDPSIAVIPAVSHPCHRTRSTNHQPSCVSSRSVPFVSAFNEKDGPLSSAFLLTQSRHFCTFGFRSGGKPPAATVCHLRHTFFPRPQATKPFQMEPLGTHRHFLPLTLPFSHGRYWEFYKHNAY